MGVENGGATIVGASASAADEEGNDDADKEEEEEDDENDDDKDHASSLWSFFPPGWGVIPFRTPRRQRLARGAMEHSPFRSRSSMPRASPTA